MSYNCRTCGKSCRLCTLDEATERLCQYCFEDKPKMNRVLTCFECKTRPVESETGPGLCDKCYAEGFGPKMKKIERSKVSVGDRFRCDDTWFKAVEVKPYRIYFRYERPDGSEGALHHTDNDLSGFDEYIPVKRELEQFSEESCSFREEVIAAAFKSQCTCGAKYVKDMTHSHWCGK